MILGVRLNIVEFFFYKIIFIEDPHFILLVWTRIS